MYYKLLFSVETYFPTFLALRGRPDDGLSLPVTVIKQLKVLETTFHSTPQPRMDPVNSNKSSIPNFLASIFGARTTSTAAATNGQKKVETPTLASNGAAGTNVSAIVKGPPVPPRKPQVDSGPTNSSISRQTLRRPELGVAEDALFSLQPSDVLVPCKGHHQMLLRNRMESRATAAASSPTTAPKKSRQETGIAPVEKVELTNDGVAWRQYYIDSLQKTTPSVVSSPSKSGQSIQTTPSKAERPSNVDWQQEPVKKVSKTETEEVRPRSAALKSTNPAVQPQKKSVLMPEFKRENLSTEVVVNPGLSRRSPQDESSTAIRNLLKDQPLPVLGGIASPIVKNSTSKQLSSITGSPEAKNSATILPDRHQQWSLRQEKDVRSSPPSVSSDASLNGSGPKQSSSVKPSRFGDQDRKPVQPSAEGGSSGKAWPEREKNYFIDYDVLRLPPSASGDFVRQMYEQKDLSEGTLLSLKFEREFGWIKLPNGSGNEGQVSFIFRNLVNLCVEEVVLMRGMKLKFSRDKKQPSR
jgi:hypothetical protein